MLFLPVLKVGKKRLPVSANGNLPKYDIRDWSENHAVMGKGITLTEEELRKLKELIDKEIALLDQPIE